MAFDQATRERICISECTCAMQTVSWPPTYLATCITLPLSVRGPTEKIFWGVATRFASGHRKSATQACTNDVYCRKGTTQRWAIVSFASSLSELCHALSVVTAPHRAGACDSVNTAYIYFSTMYM